LDFLVSLAISACFTIGSDASAVWGNGKSAHDPDAKILFFGHTKGAFAGFGLDGAVPYRGDRSNDIDGLASELDSQATAFQRDRRPRRPTYAIATGTNPWP
jgi:lipid-binding SYLF domain-containing protein